MDYKKINNIFKYLRILVILIIIYICILLIEKIDLLKYLCTILKIMVPLFIGIIIAWLLKPIIDYFSKWINRAVVCIIIYTIILFFIYIVLMSFMPKFVCEFDEFIKVFPNILNSLFDNIKINVVQEFKGDILCGVDEFLSNVKKGLPSACMNILSGISDCIIGLIIGFYLLISNKSFNIKDVVKKKTYKLLIKIDDLLRGYVKGTLLSAFLVFILSTISFYLVGLNGALLFGFICGITNIIPFVGPYIGASIPVLISFTKSISFGIIVSVIIFIIQTIEGNIINPLIMSKSVNIHPITSIMSLLIFGYFFGIIGMIFAVPIAAIGKEIYLYYVR